MRPQDIDINMPFEELPKADQDFVIEGERRSGEYTEEDYEKRSVVWRPRFLSLAGKQDLQNACTRLAQPLSRLRHLSSMQRWPVSTRSLKL